MSRNKAPWVVWAWNERAAMWMQAAKGTEEEARNLLARYKQSAAVQFAMSREDDPLPEPPAVMPGRKTRQGAGL